MLNVFVYLLVSQDCLTNKTAYNIFLKAINNGAEVTTKFVVFAHDEVQRTAICEILTIKCDLLPTTSVSEIVYALPRKKTFLFSKYLHG